MAKKKVGSAAGVLIALREAFVKYTDTHEVFDVDLIGAVRTLQIEAEVRVRVNSENALRDMNEDKNEPT